MVVGAIDTFNPFQLSTERSELNPFAQAQELPEVGEQGQIAQTQSPFTKESEIIEAFQLQDPKNRLLLINCMDKAQQLQCVSLLDEGSLNLGMQLYEEDKILDLLFNTDQNLISQVLLGIMSMEDLFSMIPEDTLNNFLLSDKLEKDTFVKAFDKLAPEDLQKMLEALTGMPQKDTDPKVISQMFSAIPDEKIQPVMLAIFPEQKGNLTAAILSENDSLFELFPKSELISPLKELGKDKTVKGLESLDNEALTNMVTQLPEEMIPLLLTMIDPQVLAKAMIEQYGEVISKALTDKVFLI